VSAPETQRRRPNPFYPAFDLLLAKLLAAEQALRVSEALFENALQSPDEWLAQIPEGELPGMLADICDLGIPGYVKNIPSFRWPDREKDYLLRAVRDFRSQSCLWSIARGFEHFREFVESIVEDLPSDTEEEGERMRFDSTMKRIRDAAPDLAGCESENARRIPLRQWIRLAARVRHGVAHNEGILSPMVYERYRSSGLEKHFPGELEADTGYVLKPTLQTAAKTIRTFGEYGLAIYKAISEAHGFPATLLGPNGSLTTWRR